VRPAQFAVPSTSEQHSMSMITGAIIGAVGGLALINGMALIAKNGNKHYDETSFTSSDDVLAKVDSWAQSTGYRLVSDENVTRRYQKGRNLLTSPMFLDVARAGDQYVLKSYVQINGLIIRGDMPLTAGGFVAKVPRASAKSAHNQLLTSLGQRNLA
jgi:hypothetical protein